LSTPYNVYNSCHLQNLSNCVRKKWPILRIFVYILNSYQFYGREKNLKIIHFSATFNWFIFSPKLNTVHVMKSSMGCFRKRKSWRVIQLFIHCSWGIFWKTFCRLKMNIFKDRASWYVGNRLTGPFIGKFVSSTFWWYH
jgi:hypothetical protein